MSAARDMVALNRPVGKDYDRFALYVHKAYPFHDPDKKWIYCKEDLVTLRPGREYAWLDAVVDKVLMRLNCKAVKVRDMTTFYRISTEYIEEAVLFRGHVRKNQGPGQLPSLNKVSTRLPRRFYHRCNPSHSFNSTNIHPLLSEDFKVRGSGENSVCWYSSGFYLGVFGCPFSFHSCKTTRNSGSGSRLLRCDGGVPGKCWQGLIERFPYVLDRDVLDDHGILVSASLHDPERMRASPSFTTQSFIQTTHWFHNGIVSERAKAHTKLSVKTLHCSFFISCQLVLHARCLGHIPL